MEDGLFVATAAYIQAKGDSRNSDFLEMLHTEAENFAKICARICEIKNGYLDEDLKERSENCREWLEKQEIGFHLERYQPKYAHNHDDSDNESCDDSNDYSDDDS